MDEFDEFPDDGKDARLGCLICVVSAVWVITAAVYLYRWLS